MLVKHRMLLSGQTSLGVCFYFDYKLFSTVYSKLALISSSSNCASLPKTMIRLVLTVLPI